MHTWRCAMQDIFAHLSQFAGWPVIAICAIICAIIGIPFLINNKNFSLGGLLDPPKAPKSSILISNTVPESRPIGINAPDIANQVQVSVAPLLPKEVEINGMPTIAIIHPETLDEVHVHLPIGVSADEVHEVHIVEPGKPEETIAVKLKDGNTKGETEMSLDDLISVVSALKEVKG